MMKNRFLISLSNDILIKIDQQLNSTSTFEILGRNNLMTWFSKKWKMMCMTRRKKDEIVSEEIRRSKKK